MANTDAQIESNNGALGIIDIRPDVVVRVALLGLALGVVAWGLGLLLSHYAVGPILCPTSGAKDACSSTDSVAGNIALIATSVAGMLGLVRFGVYRPMLVAIAVAGGLWGIGGWLSGIVWYEALGWSALIYMAAYVAFTWLVRPRNLIIVVAVLAALIVAVHYIATL